MRRFYAREIWSECRGMSGIFGSSRGSGILGLLEGAVCTSNSRSLLGTADTILLTSALNAGSNSLNRSRRWKSANEGGATERGQGIAGKCWMTDPKVDTEFTN
jgi:hypothetical protein